MSNNLDRLKKIKEEEIEKNEENFINRREESDNANDQEISNVRNSKVLPSTPYEDFFVDSPYRKEKLVNLQLPKTIHQKLLLMKQIKGVNMMDFISNVMDDWFKTHGDELKKEFNQLKKLLG